MSIRKNISIILLLAGAVSVLSSCGPVNFLTRTKKVPRRYSVNYNYPNVRAERSDLNDKAWVVYSDRAGSVTTMRPGGTLPFRELKYMESLYVIGRRGDYYKLLKYNPAILENEKLSKRGESEYYGWIHKDYLLLFNNSETEVRNGIKLKSLAAITDCAVVLEAERYFNSDSLVLHSDPELKDVCGGVGVNSMMYVLKRAENGSRVLVAQKSTLSPDEMEGMPIGWVDASLIAPFGQRLAFGTPPEIIVPAQGGDTVNTVRHTASPVSLSPALFAYRSDTALVFRTLDASEILDHSGNRIYNVDGNPISWGEGKQISSDLKNINVIFAFVPTENVVGRMPILSNAIQNLKPVFEKPSGGFNYNFAAVIGEEKIDFEPDYLTFSDRLIEAGQNIDTTGTTDFVGTLRGGLALAGRDSAATNILVLIGEKSPNQIAPKEVHDDFMRYNGRLLSYQIYTDNENSDVYNNFVLQSLDVIETYADTLRTLKRNVIVYTDQLRSENQFLEGAKNAWALDFPARSMTQGAVVFPEKGTFADPGLLIAAVDSLVRQVELDNTILTGSIDRAFAQVGRHRSRFRPAVAEHLGIDPQTPIAPHIGHAFNEVSPDRVEVTERVRISVDSLGMSTVGLLLSEGELEEIGAWVERLASMKPDRQGEITSGKEKARRVRRVRRDLRGVPPDITEGGAAGEVAADSSGSFKYASTGRIRRHLRREYVQALKECVFEGRPRQMTLAGAQEYITTMPTVTPELNAVVIKNLRRKRRFTDRELELLIRCYEEHRGLMESDAVPVQDLTVPGGEKFFFLPSDAMP